MVGRNGFLSFARVLNSPINFEIWVLNSSFWTELLDWPHRWLHYGEAAHFRRTDNNMLQSHQWVIIRFEIKVSSPRLVAIQGIEPITWGGWTLGSSKDISVKTMKLNWLVFEHSQTIHWYLLQYTNQDLNLAPQIHFIHWYLSHHINQYLNSAYQFYFIYPYLSYYINQDFKSDPQFYFIHWQILDDINQDLNSTHQFYFIHGYLLGYINQDLNSSCQFYLIHWYPV